VIAICYARLNTKLIGFTDNNGDIIR